MGSNLKAMIAGGIGAAVLVGMTPTALATPSLKGLTGHIDIPEIAGTGNGPKTPGFADGFDFVVDPDLQGPLNLDEFLLRRDWDRHQLQDLRSEFGIPGSTGAIPEGVAAVPAPGAVGLGVLGVGLLGLRRRRA